LGERETAIEADLARRGALQRAAAAHTPWQPQSSTRKDATMTETIVPR
jgi:hypothetical protein